MERQWPRCLPQCEECDDHIYEKRKSDLEEIIDEARVIVQRHTTYFNTEATRWLGVYLNIKLQFQPHKNLAFRKTRRAEDKVRRLTVMRGLTQGQIRRIQVEVVVVEAFYGTETWWN